MTEQNEIEAAMRRLLREKFPQAHVSLKMWPTGGEIELDMCEECGWPSGSEQNQFCQTYYVDARASQRSFSDALDRLTAELAR